MPLQHSVQLDLLCNSHSVAEEYTNTFRKDITAFLNLSIQMKGNMHKLQEFILLVASPECNDHEFYPT